MIHVDVSECMTKLVVNSENFYQKMADLKDEIITFVVNLHTSETESLGCGASTYGGGIRKKKNLLVVKYAEKIL